MSSPSPTAFHSLTRGLRWLKSGTGSPPLSGPALAGGLLLSAFLVICVLTWQGWRAAEAHEAMTEQALHDYGEVALWKFTRAVRLGAAIAVAEGRSRPAGPAGRAPGDPRGPDAGGPLSAEDLQPLFEGVLGQVTLLPTALTGGADARDLLFIEVVHPERDLVLYRSGPGEPEGPLLERPLAGELEGAVARLGFLPAGADLFHAGTAEGVEVRLLLGLLGLTGLLLVLAGLQLRRELALARHRSAMMAEVSHELRNPAAQIRMFAETLQHGRAPSSRDRERSLDIIVRESQHLSDLVNNVLLYARRERGAGPRPTPVRLSLRPFLEEVLESFRPLAEARNTALRLEPGPEVEAEVDPKLLRQAVLNLLDNALKYGPAGQTIRVAVEPREERFRIFVQDEGPGIPEEEAPGIFDPFTRLERDREAGVAGAGIGLAVVHDVAECHGGRVEAGNTPSSGARFILDLPTKASAPAEAGPPDPASEEAGDAARPSPILERG